jgi:hypothetical protein
MIGFIGTSITSSYNRTYYSAISDLLNLQFNVAYALGFSVFTSRLLATDLNAETSTSNHYEIFFPLFSRPGTSELNQNFRSGYLNWTAVCRCISILLTSLI